VGGFLQLWRFGGSQAAWPPKLNKAFKTTMSSGKAFLTPVEFNH